MGPQMAAAITEQFRINPGRRDEFLEIAREQKALAERLGAKVAFRQTTFGGEASGVIIASALFEDPQQRAKALEQLAQEATIPVREMIQSADPAATFLGRVMLNEITPNPQPGIPPLSRLLVALTFRPAPGHWPEVQAALAEAQELHEGLGARVHVWLPQFAGTATGTFIYTTGHDGWAAQSEYNAKLQEANQGQPGPLLRLGLSGVLTPVSSAAAVLMDL